MKVRIDPLDKQFAHYIKLRDKCCQRCGGTGGLQTAHFHSRRKQSTRYDTDNSCLCCFGCHQYLDSHPFEKIDFFTERLGEEKFNLLQARARIIEKPDKKLIELYLRQQLKILTETL